MDDDQAAGAVTDDQVPRVITCSGGIRLPSLAALVSLPDSGPADTGDPDGE